MPKFTPPVEVNPYDIVENVHALPSVPQTQPNNLPVADEQSRDGFEEFLAHRLHPDEQYRPGGSIAIQDGIRVVKRYEHDGWYLNLDPKNALIGSLILFGAVNLLANTNNVAPAAEDGVEHIQNAKDWVEDAFGIGEVCKEAVPPTTTEKVTEHHIEKFVSLQAVGSSEPNAQEVDDLVATIANAQSLDKQTVVTLAVFASDDWRRKKPGLGLGVRDDENASQLAPTRLMKFKAAIDTAAAAKGIDLSNAKVSYAEVVLTDLEIFELNVTAIQNGFESVEDALTAYNSIPETLQPDMLRVFDRHIGSNRGLKASIGYETIETIEHPGKPQEICGPDGTPEEGHDYDWSLWPAFIPPLPRFRQKLVEKARKYYIDIPPHMPDAEFLKLYPQAKNEVNELASEAWAYARKYQNLFRESDRIKSTYRLEYKDDDGEAQVLQAIFVDHEPTDRSKEMVSGLFRTISQMQGGRVGRELNMVAIYPEVNAGQHGNPKKVGLGLDIQRDLNVMGVAYPSLSLVEMHMPANPTQKEVDEFEGPKWTLAHEIAGHFTDLNDETNEVSLLNTRRGHPVYATNNRFADRAKADYDRVKAQEAGNDTRTFWQKLLRRPYDTELKWDIRRGTQMLDGQVEPRHETVKTRDLRLTEAVFTRIGRFMSRYARTNAAEHYAEAAANVATGIGVPLGEEPEAAANRIKARAGYATTFNASPTMHKLLTDTWGAASNADFATFSDEAAARRQWQDRFASLEDSALYNLVEEARHTPLPDEKDLLWILTGTRI